MQRKSFARFLAALLVVAMVAVLLPTAALAQEKSNDIVVLYTNDVHCGVDATYDKETNAMTTMGYANLAAYKKAMQAEHAYVTLVDAGDAIQGDVIGTLSNGSYLIDIMNQVGYDYATFGNHEFDYGMDVALSLLDKSDAKYLSCNFTKEDSLVTDAYAIETYGDLKVAYVGICTPETFTKSTPTYFQDEDGNYIYGFCEGNGGKDLYQAVQNAIDSARKEGADVVIAVGHCGIDEQSEPWTSYSIIANTTGLDAFIDGHSHSTIPGEAVKNKENKDVILTSTGTKLANIGKMTISETGKISTELVSQYEGSDEQTAAFIDGIKAQYEDMLNEVVAHTDVDLTTMDPVTGKRMVRNNETNLGDLCADAYRQVLGADIAFVNGGGIRADIPAGDITYGQIISVHPYGNMACVIEATGQQILDALELSARSFPGESGGFLQVSGLCYTIDRNIPSSVKLDDKSMFVSVEGARRVSNVGVLNQETGKYEPIDVNKTYTLASHNYMLKSAGDGYSMFQGCKVLQDEVMIDNQVLIVYLRDYLKGVVGEEYGYAYGEGRITTKGNPFTDVDSKRYYAEAIDLLYNSHLMLGTSDTTFEPDKAMTRAELVTILYRMSEDETPTKTAPFTDVEKNRFYTDAVNWAYTYGIVKGVTETTFAPNDKVTREQMVTMLFRFFFGEDAEKEVPVDLGSFPDAGSVSNYAKASMSWAVQCQIIKGMDGKIEPKGSATRGQMATVIVRTAVLIASEME